MQKYLVIPEKTALGADGGKFKLIDLPTRQRLEGGWQDAHGWV